MIEVTVALSPATACATLPHTLVDVTIVSGPSPPVGALSVLLHAVSARAATTGSPIADIEKPTGLRTYLS